MQVDAKIFKAYDIRGIYPTELNADTAYAIGRAFATFLKADQVVVGRDMRTSGPELFEAVTRGLRDQGADVLDIGMVSTDQYYYACTTYGKPGMMVTASHNPKAYNGFKMVRQMPYLLSGSEGIQDLLRIVQTDAFVTPTRQGSIEQVETMEGFKAAVLKLIDRDALKPLKVVADTGNGMVGPALEQVYAHLPVELTKLYFEPDGTLPNHGLDPLQEENRRELQARVVEEGADVGFAFDGDGDRFFVIDDRGHFIPGDYMTALLAEYLLKKYPGEKIIYDVRASWAVADLVRAAGGTPLIERVGHAFIKRRMADENVLFAGEVSGHYYFRDFNFADSGDYSLAADPGDAVGERQADVGAATAAGGQIFRIGRDQLDGRGRQGQDRWAAGALQRRHDRADRWRLGHVSDMALQHPRLEHRAAAAPQP